MEERERERKGEGGVGTGLIVVINVAENSKLHQYGTLSAHNRHEYSKVRVQCRIGPGDGFLLSVADEDRFC